MTALFVTAHRDISNPGPVKAALSSAFIRAKERLFDIVICGGAVGGDYLAAEVVLELKPFYPLQLWLALPFEGYNLIWPEDVRASFERGILAKADRVIYVSAPPYSSRKMHIRNEWGVTQAAAVIAVWDGRGSGGTAATVRFAQKQGKPIYQINSISLVQRWL